MKLRMSPLSLILLALSVVAFVIGITMDRQATISFIESLIPYYLAVNAAMLALIAYLWITSNRSRNWPSVSGKVLSSQVKHSSRRYTDSSHGTGKGFPFPFINYAYEVQGTSFKSNKFLPGIVTGKWTEDTVKEIVASHPKGSEVTVYYNPKDPSVAFLQKGSQLRLYLTMLVFLNLIIWIVVPAFEWISNHLTIL